jgi:hypothetical protein
MKSAPRTARASQGTSFHGRQPNLIARFNVDEGTVAVTNLNVTVNVSPGSRRRSTRRAASQPFRISGEGRVTQMGDADDRRARLPRQHQRRPDNSTTEIVGDPKIGDWVFVEGRILSDDSYFADRIVLLHRAEENRFAFTGEVDAVGDAEWTISGRAVGVNDETDIEGGIALHDLVRVEGIIQSDGTLLAERIQLVETEDGLPFEFVGVVESTGDETWTISGVEIAIGDHTGSGRPDGDAKVEATPRRQDGWRTKSLRRRRAPLRVHRHGQQIDPGRRASADTSDQTEIDDNMTSHRVRVVGRVLTTASGWPRNRAARRGRGTPV